MTRKKLQPRLLATRDARSVDEKVVNRDWVQAQLLGAIARSPALASSLAFKGGTALQKVFFGGAYRFSEDLDFSALHGAPTRDDLARALDVACADAELHVTTKLGENVRLRCVRHEESEPHPTQEAFHVEFIMPWQSKTYGSVKIEITFDEPVLLGAHLRPLLVTYDDVDGAVLSYALEEIVMEKLRATQQTLARREKRLAKRKRSWLRPRSRDFYDLWQITSSALPIDWTRVVAHLAKKCEVRSVMVASIDDVFAADLMDDVNAKWEAQLEEFVTAPLPDVDVVLRQLRPRLSTLLGW
jgi:predicted nucleotidyltransferase component of viral defense system